MVNGRVDDDPETKEKLADERMYECKGLLKEK